VGDVEETKFTRKGRKKSVKVHIFLEIDGQKVDGRINVSLIDGHWVWDKN